MSSFLNIINNRHCQRAFLSDPLSTELIESVLSASLQAPSSKNTQPWNVAVVQGASRDRLSDQLCNAFDSGHPLSPDYSYSFDPLPPLFKQRAQDCGYGLFKHKGIDRSDYEARRLSMRENFTFFNAPLIMIFHMVAGAERGQFLDMGLFMQSVMLGLSSVGYGSCPQFSIACYPDIIRSVLSIDSSQWIIAGLSVGIADPSSSINSYRPDRESMNELIRFYG